MQQARLDHPAVQQTDESPLMISSRSPTASVSAVSSKSPLRRNDRLSISLGSPCTLFGGLLFAGLLFLVLLVAAAGADSGRYSDSGYASGSGSEDTFEDQTSQFAGENGGACDSNTGSFNSPY